MDQILKGLLASSHTDQVKKPVFLRIAEEGKKQQQVSMVMSVLKISSDMLLESRKEVETQAGKLIFSNWSRANRTAATEFFNPVFLMYLLDSNVYNGGNAVWILHECMLMLRGSPEFEQSCQLIEAHAIQFVNSNPCYEMVVPFCKFLQDFRDCIPTGENTSKFCVALVHAVSVFSMPQVSTRESILQYVRDVGGVTGNFLKHIWDNADQGCVMQSLEALFRIISYTDENGLEPSNALGGLIKFIPTDLLQQVTDKVVTDTQVTNMAVEQALKRMLGWLSWPGAGNVELWLLAFLRGLAAAHKYTVLIRVTEEKIEQVFEMLHHPVVRSSVLVVLSHMLLSFQHSAHVFHKITSDVPKMIQELSKQGDDGTVRQLAELMHCLMTLHPGFPELYDPILDAVQYYPRPTEEVIQLWLAQSKWTSHQTATYFAVPQQVNATGKIGLCNLGNTCYINSVIQVLFMCDSFRRAVLTAPLSLKQPLLVKLQYLFSFLSLSQRQALTPGTFIKVARPPWFEAGQQQDCSEFLKYMLDQLHEQELSRRKDAEAAAAAAAASPQKVPSSQGLSAHTLVQQMFGVSMLISNQCLKCKHESKHTEMFYDVPLAFPDEVLSASGNIGKSTKGKGALTGGSGAAKSNSPEKASTDTVKTVELEHLLNYFLAPENLAGENQYFCDCCKSKQDAVRLQSIVHSPEYLTFTLLRFSFNLKTMSRTKVFTNVHYPPLLSVPVVNSSPGTNVVHQQYALCGVVVHSGESSECGHYYSCARHGLPNMTAELVDSDPLTANWYLFNDSRVSSTTYRSFSQVTLRFGKDSAYLLVYRKMVPGLLESESSISIPVQKDMRAAVEKDNGKFLQEQELAARAEAMRKKQAQAASAVNFSMNQWKDWNDKGGPPGSCGGGGGFSAGARYVC